MVDKKKITLDMFVLILNCATLGFNSLLVYYEWEHLSAFRLLFSVVTLFVFPPIILFSLHDLYSIFLDYEEERNHKINTKQHRLQLKFIEETFG